MLHKRITVSDNIGAKKIWQPDIIIVQLSQIQKWCMKSKDVVIRKLWKTWGHSFKVLQHYYCSWMYRSWSIKNSANVLKCIIQIVNGFMCQWHHSPYTVPHVWLFFLRWSAECCSSCSGEGKRDTIHNFFGVPRHEATQGAQTMSADVSTIINIFPQLLFYSHFYQSFYIHLFFTSLKVSTCSKLPRDFWITLYRVDPKLLSACIASPLSQTQKHVCRVVQDLSIECRTRSVRWNYEKLRQYMSELLSRPVSYRLFEEWRLKKNNIKRDNFVFT